jgi:hypothetical protein
MRHALIWVKRKLLILNSISSQVWSRQRGIYGAADSLNGFLSTILIAYLASPAGGKRINQHMTALQVFRLTMESIANGNVLEKGIFMQGAGLGSVGAEVCLQIHYCMFLECRGLVSVLEYKKDQSCGVYTFSQTIEHSLLG